MKIIVRLCLALMFSGLLHAGNPKYCTCQVSGSPSVSSVAFQVVLSISERFYEKGAILSHYSLASARRVRWSKRQQDYQYSGCGWFIMVFPRLFHGEMCGVKLEAFHADIIVDSSCVVAHAGQFFVKVRDF